MKVHQGRKALTDPEKMQLRVPPRDPAEALHVAEIRATTGLKLPDCIVIHLAHSYRATIFSFDAALGAAAARLGISRLPESINGR